MLVHVGTSGYAYPEWKGHFYPDDVTNDDMLGFYGGRFDTVEINNTFYRMPRVDVLQKWAAAVPDGFQFVLKASRRITHQNKLANCADNVAYLLKQAGELGPKLGPILFQMPPFLRKDLPRLEGFLELLPDAGRFAFEFRHDSWYDDEVTAALRKAGAALCMADYEGDRQNTPLSVTADWAYFRLRGMEYSDEALERWADEMQRRWPEVYVFFKHEEEGAAPKMGSRFLEICRPRSS